MPKQVSVRACLSSVEGPNPRKRHWLKSFHSCHSFPSNTYCTEILSFPVVPSSLLRAWTRVQGSTIRQACLELMDSTLPRALIKITTSNLRFQADHSIKSPKNQMSQPPTTDSCTNTPKPSLQASGPVSLPGFRFMELCW